MQTGSKVAWNRKLYHNPTRRPAEVSLYLAVLALFGLSSTSPAATKIPAAQKQPWMLSAAGDSWERHDVRKWPSCSQQVEAGAVDPEEYALYRCMTDLREPYR
jgi:hypothetical protein